MISQIEMSICEGGGEGEIASDALIAMLRWAANPLGQENLARAPFAEGQYDKIWKDPKIKAVVTAESVHVSPQRR